MANNTRFAVIATANRPDVLNQCLASLAPQVDEIMVVDNGLAAPVPTDVHDRYPGVFLLQVQPESPVNLSRLWNIGLDVIRESQPAGVAYEIAVINDDAIVPEGWFAAVSTAMRDTGAAAACSDPSGSLATMMIHVVPGPVGLQTRMCGWAHMLAGEKGLRYDEDLLWWFGDDDMDWRSREAGGMVVIPGFTVDNQFANGQMTDVLHVQAGRDRATFAAKWNGLLPW